MLNKIDRFGIEAITGRRQFYFGELRRLIVAENIVNSYQARAKSKSWAIWANDNPAMSHLLNDAEMIANG
jgi:hypothetical protein